MNEIAERRREGMLDPILSAVILVFSSVLSACGPDAGGEMDRVVDIGTHSLHIRCVGSGSPVVVVDTGVGDTSARWLSMQDQIAAFTRVCAYDRAGYGTSEPGPMPRTSERAADELWKLLDRSKVGGPCVLVGHSLGGVNMQVFASRYPGRVAGLVLLDPPPLSFIAGDAFPDLYQMLNREAANLQQMAETAQRSTDPEQHAKAHYLEAVASEHAELVGESAAQVSGITSFGDIPLVVVAAGKSNPAFGESADAFQAFWIEQNRELTAKSSEGRFVLAQESSHYLHEDAPDLVLQAVRQVVESAR